MSFQVYVGNYPTEFSRKDVENIFRDYKGATLHKFFQRSQKCFSFISCVDMDQILSIVEEKNNFSVGGRNLIVRAANQELQDYIDLLLQEKNKHGNASSDQSSEQHMGTFEQIYPHSQKLQHNRSGDGSKLHSASPNRFEESCDDSTLVSLRVQKNGRKRTDSQKSQGKEQDSVNYSKNTQNSTSPEYGFKIDTFRADDARFQLNNGRETPKSQRNERYFSADKSSIQDPNSLYDSHSQQHYSNVDGSSGIGHRKIETPPPNRIHQYQDELEKLAWVSVTNFPIGTRVRALQQLFHDYDPIDMHMICNVARKDKTLTEAIVCFSNREVADDVILNFDNTVFLGRLLLVNDLEDLTIMKELLGVNKL